jgi:hypothetical protein
MLPAYLADPVLHGDQRGSWETTASAGSANAGPPSAEAASAGAPKAGLPSSVPEGEAWPSTN